MAVRTLDSILTEINATLKEGLSITGVGLWNEAMLTEKDGFTFPVVNIGGGKGYKISWQDTYPLQIYHRIISDITTEEDSVASKGRRPYMIRTFPMRMVCFGSIARLPSERRETNTDVYNTVCNLFPSFLSGGEVIITNSENVNKLDVYGEEFAGINMNHLVLDGIAFYIGYDIRQRFGGKYCEL